MKNILLKLSLCLSLAFISCEDDSKDKFEFGAPAIPGAFVTLDITSPVINVTDLEGSAFKANLNVPSNNVAQYDVYVQRLASTGTEGNVAFLKTITSFPTELTINAAEIASALSIDSSDFNAGDEVQFSAVVTDKDGNKSDFSNLDPDLTSEPGQAQAFRYSTYISCPFVADDIAGTYAIQPEGNAIFVPNFTTFEVVAGPGENQYTIMDFGNDNVPLVDGTKPDLVITVDPNSGVSTPSDEFPYFSNFAFAAAEPAGFTFSCIGSIQLLQFRYSCCGTYPLVLKKI